MTRRAAVPRVRLFAARASAADSARSGAHQDGKESLGCRLQRRHDLLEQRRVLMQRIDDLSMASRSFSSSATGTEERGVADTARGSASSSAASPVAFQSAASTDQLHPPSSASGSSASQPDPQLAAASTDINGTPASATPSAPDSSSSGGAVSSSAGKPPGRVQKLASRLQKGGRRFAKNVAAAIRDPRVMLEWADDIKNIVLDFFRWVFTGCRLFRANIGFSFHLLKRIAKGYDLTTRERKLLTRTTADCFKIIPFSFFILVPFAELLLPFALRLFPNLMPSTFFKDKYDSATLARKYQAKQQMAEFFQEVVAQRTQAIIESDSSAHTDKATELQSFREKLVSGREYPSVKEILRFSAIFSEEMNLASMNAQQLRHMSQMFGLKVLPLPVHNQLQLRHQITSLRREDRDYLWEGLDGLTKPELIDACRKRGIRFHETSSSEMKRELERWLDISRHKKIPTTLLLWIQTFYLRSQETRAGSKPTEQQPDPSEFLSVAEAPEVEHEPKDAFQSMELRQKALAEKAKQRLEELEHEIEAVVAEEERQESMEVEDKSGEGADVELKAKKAPVSETTAIEQEQEEKQCILQRIDDLSKAQELNRKIIDKQREMLQHQLEFMSHMRDNVPERTRDAERILLDQRVRLVEAMNTFKNDLNEIDNEIENADDSVQVSFDEEHLDWISKLFLRLDMNRDGVISRREFEKAAREMEGALSGATGTAATPEESQGKYPNSGIDRPAFEEAVNVSGLGAADRQSNGVHNQQSAP